MLGAGSVITPASAAPSSSAPIGFVPPPISITGGAPVIGIQTSAGTYIPQSAITTVAPSGAVSVTLSPIYTDGTVYNTQSAASVQSQALAEYNAGTVGANSWDWHPVPGNPSEYVRVNPTTGLSETEDAPS